MAAVFCLAVSTAASAQSEPRASVAGGYVFAHQQGTGEVSGTTYAAGLLAAAAVRLGSGRFSAAGEFGLSWHHNAFDETQQLTVVLGGVRIALKRSARLTLFAQALAGLERFSEPGLVESGVAVQPGAGFDFHVSSRVFIRAQGDYRWSHPNGATFHYVRGVAAIGVNLGRSD
jgi:hypothetical protein